MSGKAKLFRKSRVSWRITWIIGFLCLVSYHFFKMNLFHFYIYFYLVGIVSFISSRQIWSIITPNDLTFFYGSFLNRKKILLSWDQIYDVKIVGVPKKTVAKSGGLANIPVITENEFAALKVTLKQNEGNSNSIISELIMEQIPDPKEMELLEKENSLLIYDKPESGFRNFVATALAYLKGQNSVLGGNQKIIVSRFKACFDILLFVSSILSLYYFNFAI